MADKLPADLEQLLDLVAQTAHGYGNRLQAHQVAKLKGDMMNKSGRWSVDRAPVALVRAKLTELGMAPHDIETVIDLLKKRQAGRRLVPDRFHKDFAFAFPIH
ncbi:hypothetical protein MycrhDRAFT_4124 [Mycolicibacterium rhodesiae JS60]|nr:hypothetical protein MycrhDRAFT_4124 [Mycolicibacterium rhodesiae JS60]